MENFFDYINNWLESGIFEWGQSFAAYLIEKAVLGYLAFMKVAIPFAWGIAKKILEDMNLSAYLNATYAELPSMTRAILTSLRIPECLNFIFSAMATKFVLKFIPGL